MREIVIIIFIAWIRYYSLDGKRSLCGTTAIKLTAVFFSHSQKQYKIDSFFAECAWTISTIRLFMFKIALNHVRFPACSILFK